MFNKKDVVVRRKRIKDVIPRVMDETKGETKEWMDETKGETRG